MKLGLIVEGYADGAVCRKGLYLVSLFMNQRSW
jgi:hypothetical protein